MPEQTPHSFQTTPAIGPTHLLLLILPFVANDLFTILGAPYLAWLLQDWGLRLLVLGWMLLLLKRGTISREDLGLPLPPSFILIGTAVVLTGLGLAQYVGGEYLLGLILPDKGLGDFPTSTSTWLSGLDLTVGLILVAVSEEMLFRGLTYSWFRGRGLPAWAAFPATAGAFAAIHWSLGPVSVASAFVFGILFQFGRQASNSIWPGVIAHHCVNLYAFT